MEDHGIGPLDTVARRYAELRDERMELTAEEVKLKTKARELMHEHHKTTYKHNGIEIKLIAGEEDVKVRIRKVEEEEETAADASAPEQTVEV